MDLVEGAPNPKRTRRKYSSGGNNKACLILYCLDRRRSLDQGSMITKIEYNIFIVDGLKSDVVGRAVDDNGFALVSPTFQIDCGVKEIPTMDGFCVLGETLYMFEGCVHKAGDAIRKSVFAIDLTQTLTLTQETRKLEKGGPLLKKVSDMISPKTEPVALPTPDGEKIVVFPTRHFGEECVFELFEPAKRSWEPLPSITGCCEPIFVYGFVQKSLKLVVQMFDGMRVLDLAASSTDRRWEKKDIVYPGVERIPPMLLGSSFFETVEDGRFCFVNSYGLYDLKEYVGAYGRKDADFIGFAPHPQEYRFGTRHDCDFHLDYCLARCCLNNDEETGEYHFCQMVMERPLSAKAKSCRMAMIVCCVDLKSYVEMVEQLPLQRLRSSSMLKRGKITVIKAHKFSLHLDEGGRQVPTSCEIKEDLEDGSESDSVFRYTLCGSKY